MMLQVGSIIGALYHKLWTQSRAPEDGRNYRPKHVELIGSINKPLLFHLVGCLYYCKLEIKRLYIMQNIFVLRSINVDFGLLHHRKNVTCHHLTPEYEVPLCHFNPFSTCTKFWPWVNAWGEKHMSVFVEILDSIFIISKVMKLTFRGCQFSSCLHRDGGTDGQTDVSILTSTGFRNPPRTECYTFYEHRCWNERLHIIYWHSLRWLCQYHYAYVEHGLCSWYC